MGKAGPTPALTRNRRRYHLGDQGAPRAGTPAGSERLLRTDEVMRGGARTNSPFSPSPPVFPPVVRAAACLAPRVLSRTAPERAPDAKLIPAFPPAPALPA